LGHVCCFGEKRKRICRHSWPEAARVLQKAVEDSKKLKRRGTPNVVVFAGITLPQPFQFPILMTRRHVQFLHSLTEAFPASAKSEGIGSCLP
jgi:hypothetical protein